MKRQLTKAKAYCKMKINEKRTWAIIGVLLAMVIYYLLPETVVIKDSHGNTIENTINKDQFKQFIPHRLIDHNLYIRNHSITKDEFDGNLIQLNTTEDGLSVHSKNVTLSMISDLCQYHYEYHKKANCICLQNFGLLIKGACLNNSGVIDLATNIYLDRDGWSNKNSDYLVNGKPMRIADKTRIIYWKAPNYIKVVNTNQKQNICMIVCYEGGLS